MKNIKYNISIFFLAFFIIGIMGQDVQIVTLSPEQYERYKQLRITAIKDMSEAFGSTQQEESQTSSSIWKERLANMLFAQKNGQIIGMIGAVIDSRIKLKHRAHLVSFYILPEHRKKGVGTLLLNTLLERLYKKNIFFITLNVTTSLAESISFYIKYGFTITGILSHIYRIDDRFYDQYIMKLDIKPHMIKNA